MSIHKPSIENADWGKQEDRWIKETFRESDSVFSQEIALENDSKLKIYGYKRHIAMTLATWVLITMTCGVLRLLFHWCERYMLYATHVKCSLLEATCFLIEEQYKDRYKRYFVEKVNIEKIKKLDSEEEQHMLHDYEKKFSVHTGNGVFTDSESIRYFDFKKLRFLWREDVGKFFILGGLDDVKLSYFYEQRGLSIWEQSSRRNVYGDNAIIVPRQSFATLIAIHSLNPFYVFQLLSFALWMSDEYILYACVILILATSSVVMQARQNYVNQMHLSEKVHSSQMVRVLQDGNPVKIRAEYLVPGDIIILPKQGGIVYCDAVLLNGSCIVNESLLTGESDPIMKTPIANSRDVTYHNKEHSRHTLYCGTEILQTRFYGDKYVQAVVIRTGYVTTKGYVIRSVLYPEPVDYEFERHSYQFLYVLSFIAFLGFLYTLVTKLRRDHEMKDAIVEALDLITIVVPPALPAAASIGSLSASLRLAKKNIRCTNTRTICVSGSLDCICFDKTGTLTEEGLDMWGVVPVESSHASQPITDINLLDPESRLLHGMVTCHTLTTIKQKITGDPMDLKIFQSTSWILEEPGIDDNSKFDLIIPTVVRPASCQNSSSLSLEIGREIGIVRHFTFSSTLQRMTVVTRVLGAPQFNIYCKGAPESICSLCLPQTVPYNFVDVLQKYTRRGYRVIAIACRELPPSVSYIKVQRMTREEAEKDLILLGLIILENKLKPQTTPIIQMLKNANFRTAIVTGDNILTAISVARDCEIAKPEDEVIIITCEETDSKINFAIADIAEINDRPTLSRSIRLNSTASNYSNASSTHETALPTSNHSVDVRLSFPLKMLKIMPKNCVFAITGNSWDVVKSLYPQIVPLILVKGVVFARMNPDQKQRLIIELQDIGYVVAMCGDGANDCGALKAAHTGISINESEASIASSFSSQRNDIQCVVDIIREGRAVLVITFTIFKFMAAYSLTQFISIMILYSIDINLSDSQFLFIDLFVIGLCSFALAHAKPSQGILHNKPPPVSLTSLAPVASISVQVLIIGVTQLIIFYSISSFEWFKSCDSEELMKLGSSFPCHQNYAIFAVSALQYVVLTFAFQRGGPHLQPITSDHLFLFTVIGLILLIVYICVIPHQFVRDLFDLEMPDSEPFRVTLVALVGLNFAVACFIERVVCDYLISTVLKKRMLKNPSWRKDYLNVDLELKNYVYPNLPNININGNTNHLPSLIEECPNGPAFDHHHPNYSSTPNSSNMWRNNLSRLSKDGIDFIDSSNSELYSAQNSTQSVYFTPRNSFGFVPYY